MAVEIALADLKAKAGYYPTWWLIYKIWEIQNDNGGLVLLTQQEKFPNPRCRYGRASCSRRRAQVGQCLHQCCAHCHAHEGRSVLQCWDGVSHFFQKVDRIQALPCSGCRGSAESWRGALSSIFRNPSIGLLIEMGPYVVREGASVLSASIIGSQNCSSMHSIL